MFLVLTKALPLNYLRNKNILHRDIKPSNVIVSNLYYSSHKRSELTDLFSKDLIICKLRDFGEVRSRITQTSMTVCNTQTRFVNRGSPTFMASET